MSGPIPPVTAAQSVTLTLHTHLNLLYELPGLIAALDGADAIAERVIRECARALGAGGVELALDEGRRWRIGRASGVAMAVEAHGLSGRIGRLLAYPGERPFDAPAHRLLIAVAGQVARAIELAERIDQLERQNYHLRAVDQLKDDFVGNVSHELRTPLASIKGFAATMLADDAMPAEVRHEFLGIIDTEADTLISIINNILDVSKLLAGKLSCDLREGRVAPLVEDIVRLLAIQAEAKGLELVLRLVDEAVVLCDAERLKQVLKNLIGNAIKFTESGRITVTLHVEEGHAHICVRDTGIGIDPKVIDRVFERFFREENVVHTREGTGLGLAIARQIVEHHGGHLQVSSEIGVGSAFTVVLPVWRPR